MRNPLGIGPIDTSDPLVRDHPLWRGLAGYWMPLPGLDGGARLYNLTGLNHGTLTNMTAGTEWRGSTAPGHHGDLLFDGSNDYVQLDATPLSSASNWTLAAWCRPLVASARNTCVMSMGSDTTGGFALMFGGADSTNSTIYVLYAFRAWINSGYTWTQNAWHHVVATRDTSTLTIYVNGVQVYSATDGAGPVTPGTDSRIGYQNNTQGSPNGLRYFNGNLTGIGAWSRWFTANNALGLYNESRMGYPTSLQRRKLWQPSVASAPSTYFLFGRRWDGLPTRSL